MKRPMAGAAATSGGERATSNAARQRAHWDLVLAADNIGREPVTARGLLREAGFARTPDFRLLLQAVSRHPNPVIVDLGGGLGAHAVALAMAGHRVVVADVSGERLRALRRALGRVSVLGRVLTVQTSAEHLALRSGAADVLWTKSVLIHTELDSALQEIARVLGPRGDAVLCEPMDAHPLITRYRRRHAPREWQALATHFTPERIERALGHLRDGAARPLYLLSAAAFFFQFGVRSRALFRLAMWVLMPIDHCLLRVSRWARRHAWFTVMTGRGR